MSRWILDLSLRSFMILGPGSSVYTLRSSLGGTLPHTLYLVVRCINMHYFAQKSIFHIPEHHSLVYFNFVFLRFYEAFKGSWLLWNHFTVNIKKYIEILKCEITTTKFYVIFPWIIYIWSLPWIFITAPRRYLHIK